MEEVPVSLPPPGENLGTFVKQTQSYEVFAMHHDLMFKPFDS